MNAEPVLRRMRELAALLLWEAGAVRVNAEEPFELASGNRSPIYVNCRQVVSSPAFMGLYSAVARSLLERRGITADAVAGGETAGIPYAAYLARELGLPFLYVRKKPKGYGIGTKVEGALEPGARVLLVEDLVTDGGSKLGFVEALRESGAEVSDALVLFDRQQGGEASLGEHGVRLHAVTDLATALAVAGEGAGVAADALASVEAYLADPAAWHEARGLAFHAATG